MRSLDQIYWDVRYEVRFTKDGSLKEIFDWDSLEKAKACAIAMGNWNQPCYVLDTREGEIVFESKAYSCSNE